MGLFSSLFPSKTANQDAVPLGLQILYSLDPEWNQSSIQSALQSYDSSLQNAKVGEVIRTETGGWLCEIAWKNHRFRVVGFALPMPSESVEACLAPSHYDGELKNAARAHQAHALVFVDSPPNQILPTYADLGLLTGALVGEKGLAVLNEAASISLPALLFNDAMEGWSRAQFFDALPPLHLYAGFIKYDLPEVGGVFMTTRGLHVWGIPNLGTLAPSHEFGSRTLDIFSNVAAYMMSKGPVLESGHTMQVGQDIYMKVRAPEPSEEILTGGHPLLIAEFISSEQANQHLYTG